MIFELWQNSKRTHSAYFPKDESYQSKIDMELEVEPELELTWTYDARSYFEAMQAYYDHMDFGTWKPQPDWEDTTYE